MTTADPSGRPPVPVLADFPLQAEDKLRYGDTDRQGHVNNAVFATFFETGRCELMARQGRGWYRAGTEFVLARLELDYLREVLWPGTVVTGSRILSVGRSSMRLEQAVFQNGECMARGVTVMVRIDTRTRATAPFDEQERASLMALQGGSRPEARS